jgi:hypothetical protein
MAKRRRRRARTRRKRPGAILIIVLLVLAAGFMTRRLLLPGAMHFLTHRSPDAPLHAGVATGPDPDVNGSGENLSDSDRQALDRLLRQRTDRR